MKLKKLYNKDGEEAIVEAGSEAAEVMLNLGFSDKKPADSEADENTDPQKDKKSAGKVDKK